jgi:anthranilate phosphoribosyltransferase
MQSTQHLSIRYYYRLSFTMNLSILDARTQGKRSFCGGRLLGYALEIRSIQAAVKRRSWTFKANQTVSVDSSLFSEALAALLEGRDLSAAVMRGMLEGMLSGALGEVETTAFLVSLRWKGESAEELAAAAEALRGHMIRFDAGSDAVLDTCGTGGDGSGTFNISTAAALVAAGAGVPVVKHGNRAQSSRSGSADVLAELGVDVEGRGVGTRQCLEHAGLAFCLAPRFHPALKQVAGVRRRLGVRTLFNCIGPLANPAGAAYQLLGVGRVEWLDRMADALVRLKTKHAVLVCGRDGVDEVSLSSPTLVREVRDGLVRSQEWTPEEFGLPRCRPKELHARGPKESAARIHAILSGESGPATDVVLANTAAALLAADRVATLRKGVASAADSLRSGRAMEVLRRLVAYSHDSGLNDSPPLID